MRTVIEWNPREEVEWLRYTVQPPLGILTGDYYVARNEFGTAPGIAGHYGSLEVVVKDGAIVFAEFNEKAMEAYYNQYFSGADKRRSDYGIWQASKPRMAKEGVVLPDGMLHVEAQILERQSLEGDFELLTGASGSMRNMLPLATQLAEAVKHPSEQQYYSIAEDFGYGVTGWLRVITQGAQLVSLRYDEVFADHQEQIAYPELKRYYRQSKYHSPCFQDPFPPGWDRHCWNASFRALMDLLEQRALERQELCDIQGLPYTDGKSLGALWDQQESFDAPIANDTPVRYPAWDNYLRLAEQLKAVLPAPAGRGRE